MFKSSYCESDHEILFYHSVFPDKARNVNYHIDLQYQNEMFLQILMNARILIFVCIMGLVSTIMDPMSVNVQQAGKDIIVKMVILLFVFVGRQNYFCIFIVKFFLQNKEFRSILQVNCCKNNILKIANNQFQMVLKASRNTRFIQKCFSLTFY